MIEPWPSKMSWLDAVRHFAPAREAYMRHFDSPEQRLHDKNPVPFRLP
jgi:transposase